jgi:hypothetical protein
MMTVKYYFILTFLIVLAIILGMSCKTASQELTNNSEARTSNILVNNNIDSTILKIYGDTLINKIIKSKSISAFHIQARTHEGRDTFLNFEIINKKNQLSEDEQDELKRKLLFKENYWIEDISKRCEFYPSLGFLIKEETGDIKMLLDFHCDVLKVIQNNHERSINFDNGHRKFVQLGRTLFNDAFQDFLTEEDENNEAETAEPIQDTLTTH